MCAAHTLNTEVCRKSPHLNTYKEVAVKLVGKQILLLKTYCILLECSEGKVFVSI